MESFKSSLASSTTKVLNSTRHPWDAWVRIWQRRGLDPSLIIHHEFLLSVSNDVRYFQMTSRSTAMLSNFVPFTIPLSMRRERMTESTMIWMTYTCSSSQNTFVRDWGCIGGDYQNEAFIKEWKKIQNWKDALSSKVCLASMINSPCSW